MQVDLSWQPSSAAISGYYIYRGGSHVGTVSSSATTYSDTGPLVFQDNDYCYTVRAFDDRTLSDASNVACAHTWSNYSPAPGSLDVMNNWGKDSSVAIDPTNTPHVSFYDANNLSLRYAKKADAYQTWSSYAIVDSSNVDGETSIAVDSASNAHIAYIGSSQLRYATNASGGWIVSVVDTSLCRSPSIAVDGADKVHIAFYDRVAGQLRYVTNASGLWVFTTVDDVVSVGDQDCSIALDVGGSVHISYCGQDMQSDHELNYATNKFGAWARDIVDTASSVGRFNSIAVDSNGKVHIAYHCSDWGEVKYAHNAAGYWNFATVAAGGYEGENLSMDLDSSDNAHISYIGESSNVLMYATNSSGSWENYRVDEKTDIQSATSLSVDLFDKVHITYFVNSDLSFPSSFWYATNAQ